MTEPNVRAFKCKSPLGHSIDRDTGTCTTCTLKIHPSIHERIERLENLAIELGDMFSVPAVVNIAQEIKKERER